MRSAEQRRAHTQAQFGRVDVPFAFFDAITPAQLEAACARLGVQRLAPQPLTPGELACFFSHLCVWEAAFAASTAPCIAVFEDDMLLSPRSRALLAWAQAACRAPTPPFDLLKLETMFTPQPRAASHTPLAAGFAGSALSEPHFGAGGYLITRAAAAHLTARARELAAQHHQLPPVDVLLFGAPTLRTLRVWQTTPAMCAQERFWSEHQRQRAHLPNDLEAERLAQSHLRKRRRSLGAKLWAELSNPFRKLWRAWTMQPVPFDNRQS